jgi:hypothetical protein
MIKNRLELINLFQNNNLLKKGIEVGSYKGEYANQILRTWTGDLYLVDVWRELNTQEYSDFSNQKNYEEIITQCCKNIKNYENRCFMIRSDSYNASKLFSDNYFDFIYIDANHKYEYVLQDLELWFPKLRKGGVFAGDDHLDIDWEKDPYHATHPKDKHIWINNEYYGEFGVNPAIKEFCEKYNYKYNLTQEGWCKNWFFIK